MIIATRGGLELVVAAELLCPLGWYFLCLSSADCWAEELDPVPREARDSNEF